MTSLIEISPPLLNIAPLRGSTTVVDLTAVQANIRVLAAVCQTPIMAVVKADGFGHGAVQVATAALAAGAGWLGVTSVAEALHLRAAGVRAPILSWLHGPDEDFAAALRADIDLSVSSVAQLRRVAAAAGPACPARVHLKVDTGLARSGAAVAAWPRLVVAARRLERTGHLRIHGIWSHLACADRPAQTGADRPAQTGADRSAPVSVTVQQLRFEAAVEVARRAGLQPELCHLANSAAAVGHRGTRFDLVRIGIAMYGVEPLQGQQIGLRPAMTLRSEVILVKQVEAGATVGYGGQYRTGAATSLGLVPLGYADGMPSASGPVRPAAPPTVWLNGRRCRVAGPVSMDQFVIDAGRHRVHVGDQVVIFGPGDDGEPTVAEWARHCGVPAQQLLTGIGARVPRSYEPAGISR